MRTMIVSLLGIALAAVFWSPAACGSVEITRDGDPAGVVVVPKEPSETTMSAARELVHYLRKISGAELAIVREDELYEDYAFWMDPNLTVISIGSTEEAATTGVTLQGVGPEGFRIKTAPKRLFVVGREDDTYSRSYLNISRPRSQRGTLYAVYALLEDYLGVRWLWPGRTGEVVPTEATVMLPEIDRTETPRLSLRNMHMMIYAGGHYRSAARIMGVDDKRYLSLAAESDEWATRQRMGSSAYYSANHSFGGWWERYGAAHPEWFALKGDGSRERVTQAEIARPRMCLANAELAAEKARVILGEMEEQPYLVAGSAGLSDGASGYCGCEACEALGPTMSDRVIAFTNGVAERVAAARPHRFVATLAYVNYTQAPKDVTPHPNVMISFTGGMYAAYFDPEDVEALDGWIESGVNLWWRPNVDDAWNMLPQVAYRGLVDRYIVKLRTLGDRFRGVAIDPVAVSSWSLRGLDLYVLAKLMWDPEREVESIVEDYCRAGFGAAAGSVRAYFDEVGRCSDRVASRFNSMGQGTPLVTDHRVRVIHAGLEVYTPAEIERLSAFLDEAVEKAGKDEEAKARVAFLKEGLDFTEAYLATHRLRRGRASATAVAKSLEGLLARARASAGAHALSGLPWWYIREGRIWVSHFGRTEAAGAGTWVDTWKRDVGGEPPGFWHW